MFGKKAKEIQRLRKILKSKIILVNSEGEELFNSDFEYIYAIASVLSPNPFLTEFFKMARVRVEILK